jgi:hypothetical protein
VPDLQKAFEGGFKPFGRYRRSEAADDVAPAIDQELRKVPFDALGPQESGAGSF